MLPRPEFALQRNGALWQVQLFPGNSTPLTQLKATSVCGVLGGVAPPDPLSTLGVIGALILGVEGFWTSPIVDRPAQG